MSLLILAVIVFLGIPLAITLATPARYLKFYLLWLAMLAVLAIAWPSGTDHSRFAGLGDILEATWLGITTFFVVVKLAVVHVWQELRAESSDDTYLPDDGFALGLAALTGLFVAPWSMFLVSLAFSAGSSAMLAHGSTSTVLIAAAALVAISRNSTGEMLQTFASALLGSAIITLVMAAIQMNARIGAVIDQAETAANGRPYCIQIDTTSSGYRPAVTRLDLSPLMMRARCSHGWCFSHHAVLTIDGEDGRRQMHWSYGRQSFQDGTMGSSAAAVCKPARDFARRLPML